MEDGNGNSGQRKEHRWLRRYLRHWGALIGTGILLVFLFLAILGPDIVPYDSTKPDFAKILQPPDWQNWMGTDPLGRDILSRVVDATRISLSIVIVSVVVSGVLGGAIGLWAANRGRYHEMVLMRAIDIALALPGFLVALLVITILGTGTIPLIVAIVVNSFPGFARISHASTLTVQHREYIEAARAVGAGDGRIMVRHILPNIIPPLIVMGSLRMATALLTVSGLSFLGLGIQPPLPEWGGMLAQGRVYLTSHPHVVFFPGMMLLLATLGFNLLGDGLRDLIDPLFYS